MDPSRQISNRSNQLSLEQLKLPRGPETELHGNNLTKDAEQNGGYRPGLENCVLSETADHCFFRCQPPRVPPTPSRPVWTDVLSRDFLLRNSELWLWKALPQSLISPSAHTRKRVLENQKIKIKEATNGNPGCRRLHSGAVGGKCGGAVDEAQHHKDRRAVMRQSAR